MHSRIFICYRRGDSRGSARAIYERLEDRFGRDNVFFDVEHLTGGLRWRERIEQQLAQCNALVAVIGRDWLSSNEKGRRIDQPDDPVRVEIETALTRSIPVFPVLVDRAELPSADDLPESLKHLPDWQSVEIDERRFDYDIDRLIDAISSVIQAGVIASVLSYAPLDRIPRTILLVVGGALLFVAAYATFRFVAEPAIPDAPVGVALIDLKSGGPPRTFDFATPPGLPYSLRLFGRYGTVGGQVLGTVEGGSIAVSDTLDPQFASRISRIDLRACYLRKINGVYQMDAYPAVGKTSNSKDTDIKYDRGVHADFPAFDFAFDLPSDARASRIWLCAALENRAGYIPAQ